VTTPPERSRAIPAAREVLDAFLNPKQTPNAAEKTRCWAAAMQQQCKEATVTIPYERTRAVVATREFLQALQDPKQTPRVPAKIRYWAKTLLRHYPASWEMQDTHEAIPHLFGPLKRDDGA
jgi:hypothetical protein